jgi:phosphate-selective porin
VAVQRPPEEQPRARLDYSNGSFFLRSANDNMVFVPGARMHLDVYSFAGPGVSDYQRGDGTGLKTNLFFRRFVLEFGGVIRRHWFYWLGGNFAPTRLDGNQNSVSTANVYDGFVGYQPNGRLRIYFGQYNAPYTMENTTSSRWLDFMERSLSVRTLAIPANKADGLMVWGETQNRGFEYQVGIFGGDGMNRPNIDNRFDGMTRLTLRPLAKRSDTLSLFHIGASARLGFRDPSFVRYDAPGMSTPGGYTYWSPTYTDADGSKVHVVPSGRQASAAAEFFLPFERFDLRGEFVYINENRHEVLDSDKSQVLRGGKLTGYGAYAQVAFWLLSAPRINGNPAGTYGVLRAPDNIGAEAQHALQFALRGEIIRAAYDGNARGGSTPGALSAMTNNIDVNAFQAVLTYWATRHVRLTAEYSLYQFPHGPQQNQALAPGAAAGSSPNAHILNELSFRLGLAI